MSDTTTVATTAVATNRRKIDSKLAIAILNARATVKPSDAGTPMKFFIQGTPQFLAKGFKSIVNGVERENGFDRTIYNLKANSALAMAANKSLFTEAMKAESIADTDKASDLFNEYLNKCQLSFSVIENEFGTTRKFSNGQLVSGVVGINTSELTGNRAIIIDSVALVPIEMAAKTTFSVEDLLEEVAAVPAP